jgi:hypothetical protein
VGLLLSQSCETSHGAYPFPDPAPSGWSLPEWAPAPSSSPCVVLDGSVLRPVPTVTVTESPEVEPSPLPGQVESLTAEVQGMRSLALYSGGLAIFLLAVLVFRSKSAR